MYLRNHIALAQPKVQMAEREYEFLNLSVAADYECRICHRVRSDSQQAQCCGATYCYSCAQRTTAQCPNCSAPSPILTQDEAERQKIDRLKIKCSHCIWKGELGDYQTHRSLRHPADLTASAATPDFPVSSSRAAEADTHAQEREYEWGFSRAVDDAEEEERDDNEESERHPLIELQQLAGEEQEPFDNDADESADNLTSKSTFFPHSPAKKW